MMRAPDAAPQLVDLRQAESIRAIDDDGVRGGHVDAAFDDGRAHQHVEAPMVEVEHQLFQIAFAHLAVADGDGRFRHEFANGLRGLFDGLDGVVHEVDLAAAANFAQTRLAHHRFIPFQDEGLHGQAFRRRRRDQATGRAVRPWPC